MTAYGGIQLANAARTVRKNTVQIAEDIPEDKYGFVPAPGVKSVGATLVHIANSAKLQDDLHRVKRVTTVQGYDFPGFFSSLATEEAKPRTKAEIIELLTSEGAKYSAWLETLTPEFLAETYTNHLGENPQSRLEGLLSAKEHEMHHRAQLMLMERMLGIVPHLTRQMQARMAARA
jgi:uncharacterized damage-inducible protein DinB